MSLMRQVLVCILGVALIVFSLRGISLADTISPGELIRQGDSLYALYDYSGSYRFYEQARQLDSLNFDALWKAGRGLNFMGELAPRDSQLAIFEEARIDERRALAQNDNFADAHFQLARAVGKIALFKGVFKSVGLAKMVKAEAERTLALDSLHDGAWHILGRWHREVGKKPKIFRGPLGLGAANKQDAIAFMQKAVALNPTLVNHRLEMGITYLEYDRKELAREEFNTCISLPSHSRLDDKYKEEAKKYLAKLEDR